jgi:hypothetical protein
MRRYFVVGPEQVIADDLAEAIRAGDPGARVESFRTEADALVALGQAAPRAVILSREPEGFPETPLGRAMAEGKVAHAFLGAFAEDRSDGAVILLSPFSDQTVADWLRGLEVQPDGAA